MVSLTPIALTMGEPSGISAEITFKAWRDHRRDLVPFFVIDDPLRLEEVSSSLGWEIDISVIKNPNDTFNCFSTSLPVYPIGSRVNATLAQPNPVNHDAILGSIKKATVMALSGKVGAIVTNPINKAVLQNKDFSFPGHTEFLAHLANVKSQPVMMFNSEILRVVAVTRHVSLNKAIKQLSARLIIDTAETTLSALKNTFGIYNPRIAIAGLNPHAGEEGTMGQEEITIIKPAIEDLNMKDYIVLGPLPADALFHKSARESYDVALCMYHDQALIPIKTLDFDRAVNVTLGLPFIRTSPDHGTALDIAGTGQAQETSLVAALKLASEMMTEKTKINK